MVIIAEIFKTTIDELLMDSVTKKIPETFVYTSETIYDIDCEKHFDVNIDSAAAIMLSSGDDEKQHVVIKISKKNHTYFHCELYWFIIKTKLVGNNYFYQ